MTNVPSGWYPNPHNPGEEMYWDGASWSGAARKLSAARIEEATMVRSEVDAAAAHAVPPELVEQTLVEQTLEPAPDEHDFEQASWPAPAEQAVAPSSLAAPQLAAPHLTESYIPGQPAAPPDGQTWYPASAQQPVPASTSNWFAMIALILGACGAVLTAVPFFIGLFAGGILDIAAVVFCIFGVLRGRKLQGTGIVIALIGGALGALGLVGMTVGAGTVW